MSKFTETDAERLEEAFWVLGRAGGNTVKSPYRTAWEALRVILECNCQAPEPEKGAALISNDCPLHN